LPRLADKGMRCDDVTKRYTFVAIRFNHTLADAWLNPSSWCIPLHDFDEDCLTDPQLDAEYVPCSYDDVLFGRDTSFYVNVDLVQTMPIRSLMIDNTVGLSSEKSLRVFVARSSRSLVAVV